MMKLKITQGEGELEEEKESKGCRKLKGGKWAGFEGKG